MTDLQAGRGDGTDRLRTWASSWIWPPEPGVSEGFLETQQWALDYNPAREDGACSVALEYAQSRYEEMLEVSESLDKKLDDIVRTVLAVSVIIATVAKVSGAEFAPGQSPALLGAVTCFAFSVLITIQTKNPVSFSTPLPVRSLLKVMDDQTALPEGKIKALVASSYHVAVVGTNATIAWKSQQLRRVSAVVGVGILFLLATLFTSPPTVPSATNERKSEKRSRLGPTPGGRIRPGSSAGPCYLG